MIFPYKYAFLSALLSVCLAGCGSDATTNQSEGSALPKALKTGSFLADYLERQPQVQAAPYLDIMGQWSGLLYCGGRDFPITVNAETPRQTQITITPMIGKPSVTTPFSKDYTEAAAALEVDSATRTFTLTSILQEEEDTAFARRLRFSGIISPEQEDMALIKPAEMHGGRMARSCEFGILARGEASKKIAQMAKVLAGLYGSRAPVLQQSCPPAYEEWLKQAYALDNTTPQKADIAALLYSPSFEQTFGATYETIEAPDLIKAGQIMTGSCIKRGKTPQGRKAYIQGVQLIYNLNNHRYYQSNRHTAFKTEIASGWMNWMQAELDRKAPIDPLKTSTIARMPRQFQFAALGIAGSKDLSQKALALSDRQKRARQAREFVERLEYYKEDFKGLLGQQRIATLNETYDAALAEEALDYYLVPAAATLAKGAQSVGNAAYMASWANTQQAGAQCPAATQQSCDDAAAIFRQAATNAAKVFAAEQAPSIEALYAKGSTLETLKASVAQENQQSRRFGALFANGAFDDLRSDLQKRRHALQKALRPQLVTLIENTNTAPQLAAIKSNYFIGDDLQIAEMDPVLKTLAAQQKQTIPFKEVFGADYFNALYNRDFPELRRLDAYYMESIRPLMDFGAQQAAALGPLFDALGGLPKGTSKGDIQRSVSNLSALYAVMGTYLVDYQDVYKHCLKPSAATFTISTRTDLVTTNSFGTEIKRTRGWTQSDVYKVNPEFAQNFNVLFGTATRNGGEQLFDFFLNDSRMTRLRSGMREVMRSNDCKSPTIQQFERGMLAYDRDVTRRVRGR